MTWWRDTIDHIQHIPMIAGIIQFEEGMLFKAAQIAVVALTTALVTMYGVQLRLEGQLEVIRTEIRENKERMREEMAHVRANEQAAASELRGHIKESQNVLNDISRQLWQHRIHEGEQAQKPEWKGRK